MLGVVLGVLAKYLARRMSCVRLDSGGDVQLFLYICLDAHV